MENSETIKFYSALKVRIQTFEEEKNTECFA